MNRFVRSEVEGARPRFRAAQFLQEASPTVHVYAHDRGGEEYTVYVKPGGRSLAELPAELPR